MNRFFQHIMAALAIGLSSASPVQAQEVARPEPTLAEQSSDGAPADTPTVAVIEFDFAAVHQWWAVELEVGRGIADLLADGLVSSGRYRVLERRFLPSILAEQDLAANRDRSDPSARRLVPTGRLLAAEYLIVGSVTRFGTESHSARGGGGVVGQALGLGVLGRDKTRAVVCITARLVDASTGEVVASVTSEATSFRTGLLLGGLTLNALAGLSMRSSGFRETILGEATERAVRDVVGQLVAAPPRRTRPS